MANDVGRLDAEVTQEGKCIGDDVEDAKGAKVAVVAAVPPGGAAVAALVGREHVEARRREGRHHLPPAVGELGEAVQQQDARLAGRAGFQHVHAQAVDVVDEARLQDLGQAPRLIITPESLPARGEARKATMSATCSGSIICPNEPVPTSSSQRLSSPSFSFAAAFMSGMMRSVRVAGGCTPGTRRPCAGAALPLALVESPSPSIRLPPPLYSNDGCSPAMPITLTITPCLRAFMAAKSTRVRFT